VSLSPTPQNLSTIQALRGLAALAVAVAHLRPVELKVDASPLLGSWATLGFAGVDLFFVISGFVMVWVTRAQQGQAGLVPSFWAARALRIYPLWWLILTVIVVVWIIKPDWVYASDTSTPDLLRSYLLWPATTLPLHAVGWTLIHEVWFYLVFGLLLVLPRRYLPAALVVWAGSVIAAALAMPKPEIPELALIRHPLTLEFIGGAAIGLIATKRQLPYAKLTLQIGCFLLIAAAASNHQNPTPLFEQEWPRVALFGIPFALILWGWVGLEQAGARAPRPLKSVGNWSYALYLIHIPVFASIGRLGQSLSIAGPFDNIVLLILAMTLALAAAFVLHQFFERPVQAFSRRLRPRAKSKRT
jgi:exopolysaccharide production protein ExoZ